jgi:predicted membrane-bound mannosyltransferase
LLVVYEPLILVFGLAAVAYSLWRRDLLSLFLAYWSAAALVIYLVAGGRGPGDVLLIVLPLALLAGALVGRLLDELAAKASWVSEGLFVALACPVVVYLGLELGGYAFRSARDHLWLALVAVLVLVGMLALYWFSFGRELAMRSGGLVLLLSLVVLTTSISCYLNYRRGSDPREIMLVSPTSGGILDLVETVELVSGRQGHPKAIPMTVHQGAGPASAWYLRDFDDVEFVTHLSPSIDTPVVIAPAGEQEPTLGAQYSGQDFALTSSWKPEGLAGPDLMRWLFYRRASTPVQTDSLVLWVKQELPRAE